MKIFVAIPAYNCAVQIARLLEEIKNASDFLESIWSINVFDNQSTDNTLLAALSFREYPTLRNRLNVYQNKVNIGLGGTHKVAFHIAKSQQCSHVLIIHGDNQADFKDALEIFSIATKNPCAQVLGSRFKKLSKLQGYSKIRVIGNLVLNLFYSLITKRRISDLGSGLNLFSILEWDLDQVDQFDDEFTFNMDLLLWFVQKRMQFIYHAITWKVEDETSNARALRVGARTFSKGILWYYNRGQRSDGRFARIYNPIKKTNYANHCQRWK